MGTSLRVRIIGFAAVCLLAGMYFFVSARADDAVISEDELNTLKAELEDIASGSGDIWTRREEAAKAAEFIKSELLRTSDAIEAAQEKEKQCYENMKSRIKYLYETRETTFLEILFSSKDMTEFLNRADFIRNVGEYDREMLEELEAVHSGLTDKKEALISLKKVAEDLKKPYVTFSDGATVNKAAINAPADDLLILAAILECEALPDYDSLLAVATVILNRVESPRFADSITGVVYSPGQFPPVVMGTLDASLARGPAPLSMQVARDAIAGKRLAAVQDCYYFLYVGSCDRDGVNVGDNLFFPVW